jgi:hypothetical protein
LKPEVDTANPFGKHIVQESIDKTRDKSTHRTKKRHEDNEGDSRNSTIKGNIYLLSADAGLLSCAYKKFFICNYTIFKKIILGKQRTGFARMMNVSQGNGGVLNG